MTYEAKNGCIYELRENGTSRIVATFTAYGRNDRRFGCPDSQKMAERALASFAA